MKLQLESKLDRMTLKDQKSGYHLQINLENSSLTGKKAYFYISQHPEILEVSITGRDLKLYGKLIEQIARNPQPDLEPIPVVLLPSM